MNNSRAVLTAPSIVGEPSEYEKEHVHAVYDEIASHFSSTRYKPWPIVSSFISSLLPGSVGVDLGCGNGKYLNLPSDNPSRIRTIGLDRSLNLLKLARNAAMDPSEVVFSDVLQMPWRTGFRYFHCDHSSSGDAREAGAGGPSEPILTAMFKGLVNNRSGKTTLRLVTPQGGRILIYVWAKEQDDQSKRVIPSNPCSETKMGTNGAEGIDVFVPWVHNVNPPKGQAPQPLENKEKSEVYHRYYHMFAEGELRQLVDEAAQGLGMKIGGQNGGNKGKGLTIIQEGWERSNYYIELLSWQNI